VLEEGDGHVALMYGNLLIVIWKGELEPRVCRGLYERAMRVVRIQKTKKLGVLSIVGPDARPPGREAQTALGEVLADREKIVHRSAVVHGRSGFVEAGIRSIVLGIRRRLVSGPPHSVFREVSSAVAWVSEGLVTSAGLRPNAAIVTREIEEFRTSRGLR